MKNAMKFLGLALLTLLFALTLFSCAKCKHKETEWVVEKEATCTVAGLKLRQCQKCGETVEEEEYIVGCSYQAGVCIYCGEARYGSDYLEYREITLNGEDGFEVVSIGNCTAANLTIPALRRGKPVLSIAAGAFKDSEIVVSLTVGSNVQAIGERAFRGCVNLQSVTFAEDSELVSLGGAAFAGCTALTAFTVPEGVLHLPMQLFEGCTVLESLTLHDGLLTFGDNVLTDCPAMVYKTENGVQYLGTAQNPYLALMGVSDKTVTSVTIPADTRIIGTEAFIGCTALQSIDIPEGVRTLCSYAFAGCAALTDVSLPSTLVAIGEYAFAQCIQLAALDLPDGLQEINDNAFYQCRALATLELPAGVLLVGSFAFYQTALSLTVDGGCQYLGNTQNPYLVLVGVEDKSAKNISVNEATRVIANGALARSAVVLLSLPDTLVTVGQGALDGCTALDGVSFGIEDGWKKAERYGVNGTPLTVTDSAANAMALAGTDKGCYWYR